jgi:hypothetical protein
MSQRNRNPYWAPSDVVRINSPEPMMLPARMMPGPILRRACHNVAGGSRKASAGIAYGSYATDSRPTSFPVAL